MSADQQRRRAAPVRKCEPRRKAGRRVSGAALFAKVHPPVRRAEAEPRQRVDDRAQPIEALEIVAPCARLVAVEDAQQDFARVARERRFDFARELDDARGAPLRQHAGMHHQHGVFDERERLRREPVEQFVAIRCGEDRRQRIVAVRAGMARGDGQKVQVVIAEHHLRGIAKRAHFAQHAERIGAAVDEIAGQPKAVGRLRESDQRQELAELRMTPLDVADCVERHGKPEWLAARLSRLRESGARRYNRIHCSNAITGSSCRSP